MPPNRTFPPDVKYEERIQEAARFAREHGYGLWSECETNAKGDTNELGGSETESTPGEQPPLTLVPQQTEVAEPAGGVADSVMSQMLLAGDETHRRNHEARRHQTPARCRQDRMSAIWSR